MEEEGVATEGTGKVKNQSRTIHEVVGEFRRNFSYLGLLFVEIMILFVSSCMKRVHQIFPYNFKPDESVTWELKSVQPESTGSLESSGPLDPSDGDTSDYIEYLTRRRHSSELFYYSDEIPTPSNTPTNEFFHSEDEGDVTPNAAAMAGWLPFYTETRPSSSISVGHRGLLEDDVVTKHPAATPGWVPFHTERLPSPNIRAVDPFLLENEDAETKQPAGMPGWLPFYSEVLTSPNIPAGDRALLKDEDVVTKQPAAMPRWLPSYDEVLSSSGISEGDRVLTDVEDVVTKQPTIPGWLPPHAERLPSSNIPVVDPVLLEKGDEVAIQSAAMTFDTEESGTGTDYSPASSHHSRSQATTEILSEEGPPSHFEISEEEEKPGFWVSCCGYCLECVDGLFP